MLHPGQWSLGRPRPRSGIGIGIGIGKGTTSVVPLSRLKCSALQRPRLAVDVRGDFFCNLFAPGSFFAGDSGTISARASPKRITRIGWRVFRTCSIIAEHLTLNSEKAISFIQSIFLPSAKSCVKLQRSNCAYTPITPTNSFTAAALLSSPAFSSAVSLISMICSIPLAPSFTGTPT